MKNIKLLVTIVLFSFVGVSVVFIAYRETRNPSLDESQPVVREEAAAQDVAGEQWKVVAYYFHGTRRCPTCRKIEAYTRDAVYEGFEREIKEGLLEWRPLNVEEVGNEHFVRDYALATRSVVLSMVENGKEKRWKNLDKVWELVGDEYSFSEYIQKETREFLGSR